MQTPCVCTIQIIQIPVFIYIYVSVHIDIFFFFYSVVVIFLPTLPHSNVSDLENMLVLGMEEKTSFMLKAAILITGELALNFAFTWILTRCQPCDVGCFS